MIDQTETQIRVERTLNVDAATLFAVIADPRRHAEIDGSGMVQSQVVDGRVITDVGQVFSMEMHHDGLGGDYVTENHVVEFELDRRITWLTTRDGRTPRGFSWSWQFEPLGPERTAVTHVYDWEPVTDPEVLARVNFPFVAASAMNATVTRLSEVAIQ